MSWASRDTPSRLPLTSHVLALRPSRRLWPTRERNRRRSPPIPPCETLSLLQTSSRSTTPYSCWRFTASIGAMWQLDAVGLPRLGLCPFWMWACTGTQGWVIHRDAMEKMVPVQNGRSRAMMPLTHILYFVCDLVVKIHSTGRWVVHPVRCRQHLICSFILSMDRR